MSDQVPQYGTDARRRPDEQPAGQTPGAEWREPAARGDVDGDGELRVERGRERSTMYLLRQLVGDVAVLFRKELALATSEVSQSVTDAKRSIGSIVTGGAVLYAGLLFLLGAATLGLALVMPGWAAALIVGGVVALIGLIMLQTGKSKLEAHSFAPNRTAESIRKDRDAIRRHT